MKFRISLFTLITALLLLSCVDKVADFAEGEYLTGTVKYVSLGGGFWAIYGDNNKHYDPINLPKEFCSEGKRIKFVFNERNDLASTHMGDHN
jgi:hypothetical protein